ncbi:putative fatty acyl-CoA reductase CG5065 [Galleria mellonella]|uniref:Fatty acyl-CoA reductase n=1 Tax=Galleria mellonella TaxID=7137 RepID=A0ABM3MMA1_GALME|nr:putative fatty acyl-CoA reductase CG5065 [Galleria mellonella]XP_052752503.1 putative fatty acyl-CoA reductase CG5065 [Galleria mellonella]
MEANMSVRDFYRGRNILLTGGSGFMGKVLIEKLLYSIPDLGNIYVLMRPKRGKSFTQRLEDMQRLPLFDRLRQERPAALKKIKALQGDVLFENFSLSEKDIEELSKEISVFFHFAATLKLEAPLKDNVNMNTSGTVRALNVARRLKNLAIFVHLSTAFCYPDYESLGERIHAPPANPEDIMRIIEWMDDKQLKALTPSLLGAHPNCYTYSKRLAENVIEKAYDELPVAIARPSIVCPTVLEPMSGWVDSLNGPVGLMLGAGKGVIRTMLCDGSLNAQVIPVDTAINALIVMGMVEATKKEKSPTVPVYNLNNGHQNPMTWGRVLQIGKVYGRKYPLEWPLWYPNGDITTNRILHEIYRLLFHLLPAYFIDLLMLILGQKRFMVRIQDRISQGLDVLQYFTMRPWTFPCPNYDSLQTILNDEEKIIYNMDHRTSNREEYLRACIEGGRIYCLKEDPNKIGRNRAYHNFLFTLDCIVKFFFWMLIFSYLASWFEPVKVMFSYGGPVVKYLPILGKTVFEDDQI